MSLTFTTPDKADQYEFMQDLLWYGFEDKDTEWDAYTAANADSVDSYIMAALELYSGRTMSVRFNMAFIPGWLTDPAWVKKWSGVCLEDYSSSFGGVCILEINDTDVEETSNGALMVYDVPNSNTALVLGQTTNVATEYYRASKAVLTSLDTCWTDCTYLEVTDATFS